MVSVAGGRTRWWHVVVLGLAIAGCTGGAGDDQIAAFDAVDVAPGQTSALDGATVDGGMDVGSTAAFSPVLDDRTMLTFTVDPSADDEWIDDQTGATWNLLGTAVAGDLEGTSLDPVARDDTFWFVWFAFRPPTTIAS